MNHNTAENGAAVSACFHVAVNEHKCQSQCACRVFHPYFPFLQSDQVSETFEGVVAIVSEHLKVFLQVDW